MVPLTTHEARAHLAIVKTLDAQRAHAISSHYGTCIMMPHLESFSPRCNCRRKLKFGPWRDGSRIAACRCGVSFFEADITYGVAKL